MPKDINRDKLIDPVVLEHVKKTLDTMRQQEDTIQLQLQEEAIQQQETAMRRQAQTIGFLCAALAVAVVFAIVMFVRPGNRPLSGTAPAAPVAGSVPGTGAASLPPHQPVQTGGPNTVSQNMSVTLTKTPDIPPGPNATGPLEGKVTGLSDPSAYRAVIYAHAAGEYYVQPTIAEPLCQIGPDGSFHTDVYGTEDEYYVLIVNYNNATPPTPPAMTASLDGIQGLVVKTRGHAKKGVGQ